MVRKGPEIVQRLTLQNMGRCRILARSAARQDPHEFRSVQAGYAPAIEVQITTELDIALVHAASGQDWYSGKGAGQAVPKADVLDRNAAILRDKAEGATLVQLAERYGICRGRVTDILANSRRSAPVLGLSTRAGNVLRKCGKADPHAIFEAGPAFLLGQRNAGKGVLIEVANWLAGFGLHWDLSVVLTVKPRRHSNGVDC